MSTDTLSEGALATLARLKADGCRVQGPGPVTPGATAPTPHAEHELPGMHIQIVCGHRIVDGFGATADEAVNDAVTKLGGYDPTRTG